MEKKTAGHTIYSRIRRVSVLGILVGWLGCEWFAFS